MKNIFKTVREKINGYFPYIVEKDNKKVYLFLLNKMSELQKIAEGFSVEVTKHPIHVFLIPTKQVAEGYEVTQENVRKHKSLNKDEFVENKHYCVTNSNATLGKKGDIFWTLRGVLRLGFKINSERAKIFRDWAEDTLFDKLTGQLERKARKITKINELENKLLETNPDYKLLSDLKQEIKKDSSKINSENKKQLNFYTELFSSPE